MITYPSGVRDTASLTERGLVLVLCILAALRVAIFCAAFPFFANVDEGLHFDLVVKYSRGHAPKGIETFSAYSGHFLALYNSPEYLNDLANRTPENQPKPPWKRSSEHQVSDRPPPVEFWVQYKNFESGQLPLYYLLAGGWMRLGEGIGFEGIELLYWIRFLNALLLAVAVWLSYSAARIVFSNQPALKLSVPLLLAFIPQDAFYQIQNDVLSPVCFAILFILLLRGWLSQILTTGWAVATGLAFAATYLVKTSNLPLLGIAGALLSVTIWRQRFTNPRARLIVPLVLLTVYMLIPISLWTIWLKTAFGDATASAGKMRILGWTAKPFLKWFDHPIFSLRGSWLFITELFASFWRGEFDWYAKRLSMPIADLFYSFSSIVLMIWTSVAVALRRQEESPATTTALRFSTSCILASIFFYALLSIVFDFGSSKYPSRDFPYFASGRLMLGVMVPFCLLYVEGLRQLWKFFGKQWPVLVTVSLIAVGATISEIVLSAPVFRSEFNWFHL